MKSVCFLTILYFNSQPHEEADGTANRYRNYQLHFNSQPHEEADDFSTFIDILRCSISTHSLTKRLTVFCQSVWSSRSEFQLTASRRGWLQAMQTKIVLTNFNSQPHEEADWEDAVIGSVGGIFQLTASRRGWRYLQLCWKDIVYFNSQPHEEADEIPKLRYVETMKFQLTASRRGWPRSARRAGNTGSISTHSLTKRLTTFPDGTKKTINISTHSLTKRLTGEEIPYSKFTVFQLTASRRGWRCAPVMLMISSRVFQLTASRRGWRSKSHSST